MKSEERNGEGVGSVMRYTDESGTKPKRGGGYEGFAFSRTIGMKYWCCPRCNQVNRVKVRPQTWQVQCSNEACMKRYAIGEVFYECAVGFKVPPPDTLMPDGRALKSGERINRVYCSGCAKVMYDEGFGRALQEAHTEEEENAGLYKPRAWEKIPNEVRYGRGYGRSWNNTWNRSGVSGVKKWECEAMAEEIAEELGA